MTIKEITDRIIERSKDSRADYLAMIDEMQNAPPAPDRLSCSNWAHVVAAESDQDKKSMPAGQGANIGIVTAYQRHVVGPPAVCSVSEYYSANSS